MSAIHFHRKDRAIELMLDRETGHPREEVLAIPSRATFVVLANGLQ